jgi:hypothetical protein
LPFGSLKSIADDFNINPKTVTKLWYSTMKQLTRHHANTPIDPPLIVSTLPSRPFSACVVFMVAFMVASE